jgi:hypothetical protein
MSRPRRQSNTRTNLEADPVGNQRDQEVGVNPMVERRKHILGIPIKTNHPGEENQISSVKTRIKRELWRRKSERSMEIL